jgi:hypothetical protein
LEPKLEDKFAKTSKPEDDADKDKEYDFENA